MKFRNQILETPETRNNSESEQIDGLDVKKLSSEEKIEAGSNAEKFYKGYTEEAERLHQKFDSILSEPKSKQRRNELNETRSQNKATLNHLYSQRIGLSIALDGYEQKISEMPADPQNSEYRHLLNKRSECSAALQEVNFHISNLEHNNLIIDKEVGNIGTEKNGARKTTVMENVHNFLDKFKHKEKT